MLQHHNASPCAPSRAVILGARGFIGGALIDRLAASKTPVLALGSQDIDLTSTQAPGQLAALLKPTDAVVVLAALTPDRGRDLSTFLRNVDIARAVCLALEQVPVAHVIYVSSDAVYPFAEGLVNEVSAANPSDLYGTMHRTREVMVGAATKSPYAVLRPTMVYGGKDTHNSYGPNRFVRAGLKDGKIVLGGAGEETRDHIFIEDVAKLIELVLRHRSSGVLNLATGQSVSFATVAQIVSALFDPPLSVTHTARTSSITHRAFDVTGLLRAFPGIDLTPLQKGLQRAFSRHLNPQQ